MYEISATIEGGYGDLNVVCAFDPTKVVVRLRRDFPGTEVDPTDYAWRDYKTFLRMGLTEEHETALGVAARDARRRAPFFKFRVPSPPGGWIRGRAERHAVSFWSETEFPEPLGSTLLSFVQGLQFAPCVTVKCFRVDEVDEGDNEYPT